MTWFSYEPDAGFEFHPTEAAARKAAEGALEWYRDASTDDCGWDELVASICWGEVREVVEQTEQGCPRCSMRAKPGDLLEHADGWGCEEDEVEGWVDYGLVPARRAP